ncbi:hypothetical protein quinque_014192 [Culex quinquefasciatus]
MLFASRKEKVVEQDLRRANSEPISAIHPKGGPAGRGIKQWSLCQSRCGNLCRARPISEERRQKQDPKTSTRWQPCNKRRKRNTNTHTPSTRTQKAPEKGPFLWALDIGCWRLVHDCWRATEHPVGRRKERYESPFQHGVPKILRIRLFDQMTTDFMREAVRIVIEQREKNNVVRPDLIHLLMQARDQKLKFGDFDRESEVNTVEEVSYTPNWTHDDFVSQCAVFVFGGLDTVTNIASFMAHELAINQHVQVKLREEIESILNDRDGQSVTYEDIHSMVYLDQVLTETLRKWPQAIFIDRVCTKPYDLNVDGRMISLKQGDTIWIPALPMHRDPRYFSDPEVFDPDRFASDRRDDLGDFVLMAFGIGPRLCLGNRFALMEIKTMFFWLLTKFELTRSDKTQHPPKLGKSLMIPEVKDGYWLNLKLRK